MSFCLTNICCHPLLYALCNKGLKSVGNREEVNPESVLSELVLLQQPCNRTKLRLGLQPSQITPLHKHSHKLVVISCETLKNTARNSSHCSLVLYCKSHGCSSDISFLPNISLLIDRWEKVACETSSPVS